MISSNKLSDQEIVRRLRMLRYSPDNRAPVRGGRKIPLKYVAGVANLHRATVYRALMSGQLSEKSREALSPVLMMLQADRKGRLSSLDPSPPPQDKLVRGADWNERSRCSTCGGISFSPVIMHGTKWYLCDSCLPPTQYPALGARSC
jgi:hypothetical protein